MSIESLLENACIETVRESARYLSRAEALKRYKDRVELGENPELAGFLFSLETIKGFIEDIETYNNTAEEGFEIKGIRIWKAKSPADDGTGEKLLDDVILTPTLADETDLHGTCEGVDAAPQVSAEKLLILGSARPCPNLCGGEGPNFFYELDPNTCTL